MANKKLKSLAEHNSSASTWHMSMYSNLPLPNGIECPECGEELMDTNPMMTLTSMPPKKNVHCTKCNYRGYRIA
jgi:DNA-directed RNA polymerase subunit RPC12/RpoP